MRFTTDWFAKAHEGSWACWLAPILAQRPSVRILEIGCFEGRSTVWLLQNIVGKRPGSSMVCVDPWTQSNPAYDYDAAHALFLTNVAETGLAERVSVRKASSRDVLPSLPDQSFDFVYVDGDHTEEGAAFDTFHALRLVRFDGIVAWDDIFFETPNVTPKIIAGVERGMREAGITARCIIRVDVCAVLFRGCLT